MIEPDYRNEWDIIPKDASERELLACVIYEYARESSTLLSLIADFRKLQRSDPEDLRLSNPLAQFEHHSFGLARLVESLRPTETFNRPWKKHPGRTRAKMLTALGATASISSTGEVANALKHDPDRGGIAILQPVAGKYPLKRERFFSRVSGATDLRKLNDDPRLIVPITVDLSKPGSLIKQEIEALLKQRLYPALEKMMGRSSSGLEDLRKALLDLAVLRLASTRNWDETRNHPQACELLNIPRVDGDRTFRERVRGAKKTFTDLFPHLFWMKDTRAKGTIASEMISLARYERCHPRGHPKGK